MVFSADVVQRKSPTLKASRLVWEACTGRQLRNPASSSLKYAVPLPLVAQRIALRRLGRAVDKCLDDEPVGAFIAESSRAMDGAPVGGPMEAAASSTCADGDGQGQIEIRVLVSDAISASPAEIEARVCSLRQAAGGTEGAAAVLQEASPTWTAEGDLWRLQRPSGWHISWRSGAPVRNCAFLRAAKGT